MHELFDVCAFYFLSEAQALELLKAEELLRKVVAEAMK